MSNLLKSPSVPDEAHASPALLPLLGRRWALGAAEFACLAVFCLLWLVFSYLPLISAELWSHAARGEWILAHRALPVENPFVPLAEGMPTRESAWLSQVGLASARRAFGLEGLTYLYAVIALIAALGFFALSFRMHRRPILAMTSTILVGLLAWPRLRVFGPETFGLLAFLALQHAVVASHSTQMKHARGWTAFAGSALLFAVWVNLDASFLVGLLVLLVSGLTTTVEVACRTRSFRATLASPTFRRSLYLLEGGLFGSLCHPLGMRAWSDALSFDARPLVMTSPAGIAVGLLVLGTLVLSRFSRLRLNATTSSLWIALAVATCVREDFAIWFLLVTLAAWQPHLGAALDRIRPLRPSLDDAIPVQAKEFRLSLVGLLLIWMAFAFSPASRLVLGGTARSPQQYLPRDIPLELSAHLHAHPPRGLVWTPETWGDWFTFTRGDSLQLFASAAAWHELPESVRREHQLIRRGEKGFDSLLEKYRVGSVALDRDQHRELEQALRGLPGWSIAFETDSVLLVQRTALIAPARTVTQNRTPPRHPVSAPRS